MATSACLELDEQCKFEMMSLLIRVLVFLSVCVLFKVEGQKYSLYPVRACFPFLSITLNTTLYSFLERW